LPVFTEYSFLTVALPDFKSAAAIDRVKTVLRSSKKTVLLADTGGKYVNYKVTISKDKQLE